MPFEFYVGRLCEEFGALPSEIIAERERLPEGFLERVIECRRYAEAKMTYDRTSTPEARQALRQQSPLAALAERITFVLAGVLEEA